MQVIPTEDVAAAVFALLAPLAVGSPPLVTTLSRRIQPAAQMQPGKCPAIFQTQPNIGPPQMRTLMGELAYVVTFDWVIYVIESDPAIAPTSVLNPIIDAVLGVLPTGSNLPFAVDQVPVPIFWDGKVEVIEGVIVNTSIAMLTINALIPTPNQA